MSDSDAPESGFWPTLISVVFAFVIVTLASRYLLSYNWTLSVLVGGTGSVVAAFSSWLSLRRQQG